jgi:hypothetical protein
MDSEKVFVVHGTDEDGAHYFQGVFRSEEAAKEEVEQSKQSGLTCEIERLMLI